MEKKIRFTLGFLTATLPVRIKWNSIFKDIQRECEPVIFSSQQNWLSLYKAIDELLWTWKKSRNTVSLSHCENGLVAELQIITVMSKITK